MGANVYAHIRYAAGKHRDALLDMGRDPFLSSGQPQWELAIAKKELPVVFVGKGLGWTENWWGKYLEQLRAPSAVISGLTKSMT